MKPQHNYRPLNGIIHNEEIALKIADVILSDIYGVEAILIQKPLTARSDGSKWVVSGILKGDIAGGVAVIEINKSDGRILRISHDR
jgi:hypothetical protein